MDEPVERRETKQLTPVGVAIGVLIAVAVVWVVYSVAQANGESECNLRNLESARDALASQGTTDAAFIAEDCG